MINLNLDVTNHRFDTEHSLFWWTKPDIVSYFQMGIDSLRHYYKRLHETPFSSDTKIMSVKVTPKEKPGPEVFFVKGAVEKVIKNCKR